MLRWVAILLLLANGCYFAWSQGWLGAWGDSLGFKPAQQREPQRLEQQIRPEALRILSSDEERRGSAATPAARPAAAAECLQAGVFDERQANALRGALGGWPTGGWSLEAATVPARWIVYMGRYADAEMLAKKRSELRLRNVPFESLTNPALEPGLSLGAFDSEDAASQQLSTLATRGVRTARVIQERPAVQGFRLLLPAVDETLKPRLDELKPVLAGKPLRACT